jgi:acetyl/propionyl-CoA carboxylase alpha subunit
VDNSVLIRGGTTNKSFLLDLLDQPAVLSGEADNAWLDRRAGQLSPRPHGEVALLAAAIESYETAWAAEQREFYAAAARGRPQVREATGHVAELRLRGQGHRLTVLRLAEGRYRVEVGGEHVEVAHERIGPFERWLTCGGRRLRVLVLDEGLSYRVEVEGVQHHINRDDGGVVRAPSPAVVLAIPVKPGDMVEAGARLIVLESMKMEVPVLAPQAGRVRKFLVASNAQVAAGAPCAGPR